MIKDDEIQKYCVRFRPFVKRKLQMYRVPFCIRADLETLCDDATEYAVSKFFDEKLKVDLKKSVDYISNNVDDYIADKLYNQAIQGNKRAENEMYIILNLKLDQYVLKLKSRGYFKEKSQKDVYASKNSG